MFSAIDSFYEKTLLLETTLTAGSSSFRAFFLIFVTSENGNRLRENKSLYFERK